MSQGSAAIANLPRRGRQLARQTGQRLARLLPRRWRALPNFPLSRRSNTAAESQPAVETSRGGNSEIARDSGEAGTLLLSQLKADGRQASASKIQLVHLDSLRKKFGARWSAVSARALGLAEQVLRRWLDEGDIFTRYDDFAFVVVFSMVEGDVARRRAEAINKEIHNLLNADPELAGAFVFKTATAPVSELVDGEDAPTVETLGDGLNANPLERKTALIRGAAPWMGKLSLGYQPLFEVASRTVGTFVAMPQRELEDGTVLFGEAAYPSDDDGSGANELDKLLTGHVVSDLQIPANAGNTRIVGMVISLQTLTTSKKLLYQFGQLAETVRQRFIIEIVDIAEEVEVDTIFDAVASLGGVTSGVALRAQLTDQDVARFASCGLRSIGFDLLHPDAVAMRRGERHEALRAFVERAKAAELRTHIYGVTTMDALKAGVEAGADFLSGNCIARCTEKPRSPRVLGNTA